jgi:hypothetical protein
MRTSHLLRTMLAMSAALGMSSANSFVLTDDIRPVRTIDTYRPKRRKTGRTYPHSSDRQRARYARQIAAGQITFLKSN